jgi:hypothetical protein
MRIFVAIIVLSSCASTGSIHNADIVNGNKKMLHQDYVMKKKMIRTRELATVKAKRLKTSRVKKLYVR